MRELLRRGEIPTVHIGDRTLIYDADLHEFIARHRIVRVVAAIVLVLATATATACGLV